MYFSLFDTSMLFLKDMMLMSLSCMELQLDQWLLTKGKSSTGKNRMLLSPDSKNTQGI